MLNVTDLTVSTLDPSNVTKLLQPSDPRYSFRYLGITIGFWTIFVGTIGNALTFLTYIANQKLRTTFNLLLLNLAVVDFLTSILMIPFHVAGYVQLQWPFGNESWTARLQAFSYFCCGYTSIVFLVVITINRFIGAIFPYKYKDMFHKDRMIWIILSCWIIAPMFLFPFLVGTDAVCDTPGNGLTGFSTKQLLCTFVCLPKNGWSIYMQFTRVLFQFLPLIMMVIFYVIIFTSVYKKRGDVDRQSAPSSTIVSLRRPSGQDNRQRERSMSTQNIRRRQENRRMLAISVTICIGFMITFLPSVIVNLLPTRNTIDTRWHMAASNLAWLNSSLNPLIYVVLNRKFRKECWRTIRIITGVLGERLIHGMTSTDAFTQSRNSTNT